ncbi:uncharacterized protein LOC128670226 isoform X2 [Plodia interpunctella]|uniref:uncharacterized protein LOC128670226 isoform X2 n=1 Tax=Plodia interpunctella TaxID=58824 RepID=UPI0031017B93
MMFFNYESKNIGLCGTRYILYFLTTVWIREFGYVESLRILARSIPRQAVRLQHPHTVTLEPTRLQVHKCLLLHRCSYTETNGFKARNDYYNQNSEYNKSLNSHVSEGTFGVTLRPYYLKQTKSENTTNNSSSINSYTQRSEIFDYPINDGIENHLYLATTPVYDMAPKLQQKLKQIVVNKKNKRIIHKMNRKQVLFESSESSTRAQRTIGFTGTDNVTKNPVPAHTLKEDINKINRKKLLFKEFKRGLDQLERKFYTVTFTKLTNATAGESRAENAISFVQSGLFLQLLLLAISVERAPDVKAKIDTCIGLPKNLSNTERIQLIDDVVSMLPNSTYGLIFRWSSRLILGPEYHVSEEFKNGPAAALRLHVDQFNGTESPEMLTVSLNRMVEEDSKGAIHNTFEPDDVSGTITAIFFTTIYLRSRWRTAPTVLNGSRPFRDFYEDRDRTIRMIRINDMMRYANLTECEAELGLPDLLYNDNTTDRDLKMSHGLQRLMFWAEAGRTAFKDDGIEWDDLPDMKIVVDRPYLFFVRWHDMTLMNGNFVL